MKKTLLLFVIYIFCANLAVSQSWQVGLHSQISKIYLPSGQINIPNHSLKSSWSSEFGAQGTYYWDYATYYASGMHGLKTGFILAKSNYSIVKDSSFIDRTNKITNTVNAIKVPVTFNYKNETTGWTYEIGLMYAYNYASHIDPRFDFKINKNSIAVLGALGFDWEIFNAGKGLYPLTFNWGIRSAYDLSSYSKDNNYKNYKANRFLSVGLYAGFNFKVDYYHDNNRYKNKVRY